MRATAAAAVLLLMARGEDAEDADEGEDEGSRGFFYDVVPWWHLISPAVFLLVGVPLLAWSTRRRGRWTGWAALAERHGGVEPGGARVLGVAAVCRMGPPDSCQGDVARLPKLDRVVEVAASPTHLGLRCRCCADFSGMRPLAVPWAAVRDAGVRSLGPCHEVGVLDLDGLALLALDRTLYAAAADARRAPPRGRGVVAPLEVERGARPHPS